MVDQKQCTECKRLLPLTSFHKHKPSKDGRKPRCKECRCATTNKYRQENPEKVKESDLRYRQNNKEKIKAKSKRYREENIERIKLANKRYREENREKLRESYRTHYLRNREKRITLSKEYQARHSEERKSYLKEYNQRNRERLRDHLREFREAHRERYRIYGLNYEARKNNAEGDYTEEQWLELCNFFGDICPCCNRVVKSFTIDHIIPLTWEGTSNWITNIQPLCKSCNTGKSNHHATDYRPEYVKEWANKQMELVQEGVK